jgi:hypothetical protein
MNGCPYLAGETNSLIINAARNVTLDDVFFGNNGSNPVDIVVNSTNAPRGRLGMWRSLQSTDVAAAVPATWAQTSTRLQPKVYVASATRTAGDVAITSTTLTAVDSSGALDLTLNAKTGDFIEVTRNAQVTNQAIVMDWAIRVLDAGGTGTGRDITAPGWTLRGGDYWGMSAPISYVVQAGDLVAGQVKLRLMAKLGSAGTRSIFAGDGSATPPLSWWAKNYGPQTSP